MTIDHVNVSIRLSGIEYDEPVGKRLELATDGTIKKVSLLAARSTAGRAINKQFSTAEEAFDYIRSCDARFIFFAGTFPADVIDVELDSEVDNRVVAAYAVENVQSYFEPDDMPVFLTATKNDLAFREGAGLLHIDIDTKDANDVEALWPEGEIFRLDTADAVIEALFEILPEARNCPLTVYPSSSSMIIEESTGALVRGPGGWRVLVAIDDAMQTKRILDVLHLRCWALSKYRYMFVSSGGSCLDRSLADQALGRPTQPDYPQADLGPGLAKAAGNTSIRSVDGPYLQASNVLINGEMKAAALQNIATAREALRPYVDKVKTRRKAQDVEVAVKRGVARQVAERAAERKFDAGVLLGSDFVTFKEGDDVMVSVLLSPEGEKYDKRICFDPVEPDYDNGRAVGKFYWNDGINPGVHSYAHGSKFYKLQHDTTTASAAIAAGGSDSGVIARILAMLDADPVETKQLEGHGAKVLGLGNAREPLRAAVRTARKRITDYRSPHNYDTDQVAVQATGPLSLKEPLNRSSFPIVDWTTNGLRVLDHQDNIAHILSTYGIPYRYNVIRKDFDWSHPDVATGEGDNDELSLFSVLHGLCALNGVPTKNLGLHLVGIGARDEYNPVIDHLSSCVWDGETRFDNLAESMGADDPEIARMVIRMFLIQACAAADHCKQITKIHPEYRAHFEGIMVFVGGQGAGKTKGLRRLIPQALRRYFKEGLVLNPKDKDSVKEAMSSWLVELGELEATFKKSDIATLKAFISRDLDEMRLPYAPKHSRFHRRSVFAGTVNDTSFLADETGNRRFWPLTVSRVDTSWSDEEIDQLWAEAWSRYIGGEKWWPTRHEEKLLAANAERYRFKSALEEAIENTFDWSAEPDWEGGRRTAAQIFQMVDTPILRAADTPALKSIGMTIRRNYLRSPHAHLRGGTLSAKHPNGSWVRLNAESGENRGWYLPPRRGWHAGAVQRIDLGKEREKREPRDNDGVQAVSQVPRRTG